MAGVARETRNVVAWRMDEKQRTWKKRLSRKGRILLPSVEPCQ